MMPPTRHLDRLSCLMDKHNYNFIHCSKPTDKEHKLNKREDSSTTASRSLRDGKIKASSAVIKLS